jgi:arsenite methyltransferase
VSRVLEHVAGETDLLHQQHIKAAVADAYQAIGTGAGEAVVARLYSEDERRLLPEGAVSWALGVGNPVRRAQLRPGETVLDVGSGGGIDSILAANFVRPGGRVIGIDVIEEMLARARVNAAAAGVGDSCEFLHGEMEAIPLPADSVDAVISNGVINLSPRKSRVLAELYRVLRPGGRLTVADLLVESELPLELKTSEAAWAG